MTTTPPPPEEPLAYPRRKWAGIAFLVAVFLAIAAPLASVAWLFSAQGEAFVLSQLKNAAADQLAGRLEIDALELSGFLKVELRGVKLFAPDEDRPVVAARRVFAHLAVPALLSRRIEVLDVRLEEPVLRLVQSESGSNLSRAIASRHPSADTNAQSSSASWHLNAPSVALRSGAVSVHGAGPAIVVKNIVLDAAISGSLTEIELDAKLAALFSEPAERVLALKTSGVVSTQHVALTQLAVAFGESKLDASGELRLDLSSAGLVIEQLRVSPDDITPFAPDVSLLAPVDVSGTASLDAGEAKAKLRVTSADGGIDIDASAGLDLDADSIITRWNATAQLTDVQPHTLLANMPEMNLDLNLRISNGVGMPGRGTADVVVTGRRLRYLKLPIESLSIQGALDAMTFNAKSFAAVAAGVHLKAAGTLDAERASLKAKATVASLANTRKALEQGVNVTLPPMKGSANFNLELVGPWTHPRIKAAGAVPLLEMEDVSIKDADFAAQIDRWAPDLKLSGHLAARELASGDLHGRDLRITATMDGRKVQASVDGDLGGAKVVVRANARRQEAPDGVQRWRIDELRANALDSQMAADKATLVEIANGRVKLEPLTISGDLGQLTLSGNGGSTGPIKAAIAIDALRFDRIPNALLPKDLKLSGTLKGTVDVSGTVTSPSIDARIALVDASVNEAPAINASLNASVAKGRIVADLTSNVGAARLAATVDMPLESPSQSAKKPSPVSASLTLDGVTPKLLHALVPELPEIKGTAQGDIKLAGTWAAPVFNARIDVKRGSAYGVEDVDVSAVAAFENNALTLSGTALRGGNLDSAFDLKIPFAAQPLLEGRVPDWRTLAPAGEVRLTRLSLPWLETMGHVPAGTQGTAAGRVLFGGTAQRPEISATLAIRSLVWENHRDVDATADLRVHDSVDFTLGAQLQDHPFLQITANAKVSSSTLMEMDTAAMWRIPTTVDIKVLPTPLSKLVASNEELVARGIVSASMSLTGTPDSPRVTLGALVEELQAGEGNSLGRFVVDGRYDGANSRVSARFDSRDAGTVVALATIPGQLSARSFASSDAVDALLARRAEVSLSTSGFDLALFNGLSSGVGDIAGRLNMRFKKSGPLLEPGGEGSLDMRGVKAAFLDYGEISDTELDLVFAWPMFELRRLTGRSGSGKFSARADIASPDSGESFKGSFHAELDKLPLVQHFETKGWLSLVVDTNLELRDGLLSVSPLVLSKGLLKIGDVNVTRQLTGQGKDIQSLDRNDDIVFLSELQAQKRKQEKAARRAEEKPDKRPLRTDIRLSIPNDFVIDAPLGNKLTLGANLKITIDPERAAKDLDPMDVEGRVNVVKGTVNVLRRFDITKGQLTFRPNQWKDPDVDVEAKHEGNDGTVVTVAFGGTTNHLTKRFQLSPGDGEPPSSDEADVLFYLTTGRRQTRANTTTPDLNEALATAGMNALGSLGVSGVKWIAQNLLPLPDALMPDVLAVDTDLRNGLAGSIERVRAGKYLSERIYIGGQYNREANVEQGQSFFEVEGSYRLSDQTAIKLRAAQGHYGAEVTYQKDIPTKKQRTATERK